MGGGGTGAVGGGGAGGGGGRGGGWEGGGGWGGGHRMYNMVEQLNKLYCSTLSVSMEGGTTCKTNHVVSILTNTAIEI